MLASPRTPFPMGISTTFKVAIQKLRGDTTISLVRVVVVMITGVVCGDWGAGFSSVCANDCARCGGRRGWRMLQSQGS